MGLLDWFKKKEQKTDMWKVNTNRDAIFGEEKAIIIYLDECMVLSKKIYSGWRDVQEEYYDKYKANLSPMTCTEVIQFFEEDFKEEENWPFSRNDIVAFFNSNDLVMYSSN